MDRYRLAITVTSAALVALVGVLVGSLMYLKYPQRTVIITSNVTVTKTVVVTVTAATPTQRMATVGSNLSEQFTLLQSIPENNINYMRNTVMFEVTQATTTLCRLTQVTSW